MRHPHTRRERREARADATRVERTTAPPLAERWLQGFPDETHGTVESWFKSVIGKGTKHLDTILAEVTIAIGQKLDWCTTPESRQLCNNTLVALRCDVDGARAFAQAVLAKTGNAHQQGERYG